MTVIKRRLLLQKNIHILQRSVFWNLTKNQKHLDTKHIKNTDKSSHLWEKFTVSTISGLFPFSVLPPKLFWHMIEGELLCLGLQRVDSQDYNSNLVARNTHHSLFIWWYNSVLLFLTELQTSEWTVNFLCKKPFSASTKLKSRFNKGKLLWKLCPYRVE